MQILFSLVKMAIVEDSNNTKNQMITIMQSQTAISYFLLVVCQLIIKAEKVHKSFSFINI